MEQLIAEGTVQRLWPENGATNDPLVAAVGMLQFEVLQYRLSDEYKVETTISDLPFECSAWLEGDPATFNAPTTSLDDEGRARPPGGALHERLGQAVGGAEEPRAQAAGLRLRPETR